MSGTKLATRACFLIVAGLSVCASAEDRIGFFHLSTIDSAGDVGDSAVLAVLPSGFPAIAYFDETNATMVKFAWQDAAGWHTETVAQCEAFSMTVLPAGQPALVCQVAGGLSYAYRDNEGWHISATGLAGSALSLVALPSGAPAFSFCGRFTDPLEISYATFDGTAWHAEEVAAYPYGRTVNCITDLAVTATGAPAIAFSFFNDVEPPGTEIRFSVREGGSWSVPELVRTVPSYDVYAASLAFQPAGAPAIAYAREDPGGYEINYTERLDFESWAEATVYHDAYDRAQGASLAFLPSGEPALAFRVVRLGTYGLWFAERFGGEWRMQQVAPWQVGMPVSRAMAVLPTGRPVIGFYDVNDRDLRYAVGIYYGDLNCDAALNFGDINPFVLVLTDPAGYEAQYPHCSRQLGDANGDGVVNFADINPFVALLSGP